MGVVQEIDDATLLSMIPQFSHSWGGGLNSLMNCLTSFKNNPLLVSTAIIA